jgi:hypothetical protein
VELLEEVHLTEFRMSGFRSFSDAPSHGPWPIFRSFSDAPLHGPCPILQKKTQTITLLKKKSMKMRKTHHARLNDRLKLGKYAFK